MRFLSDILFHLNHLAIDNNGDKVFDATRIMSRLDNRDTLRLLITRSMIEHVISSVNKKKDVFLKMALGEPNEQEKKLRELGKG